MSFRTVKPFQLGMLFRVVERQQSIYGCFSLLTMSLREGEPRLRSEPSLWKALAQHAPEFVEAGVIKSQPEFLVFGHAHAYDGAAEGAVGVRFGGVEKWCRVVGPRRYPDAMQPAPFEKIRLDWRHAYGGPDFPANPQGMGRARDEFGRIVLPCFEATGMPWRPDDRPQAAVGFGPLDITHPDRQKLVGTYNDEWLKTDFPGMARDADWHFFQVAPPDQWLREELRGDEGFDLGGLHPVERVRHGQLPGLCPRLFVERLRQPGLAEVRCRLRTVVFVADADAVVQILAGIHTPAGRGCVRTDARARGSRDPRRTQVRVPLCLGAGAAARRRRWRAGGAARRGPAAGGHLLRGVVPRRHGPESATCCGLAGRSIREEDAPAD